MKLEDILPSFNLFEMMIFENKEQIVQQFASSKKRRGRLFAALEKDRYAREQLNLQQFDFKQADDQQRQEAVTTLLNGIAQFDPTEDGKYMDWLVKLYLNLANRNTGQAYEDLPPATELLQIHSQYANRLGNISRYQDLNALRSAVEPFQQRAQDTNVDQEEDFMGMSRKEARDKAYAESKQVYKSGGLTVTVPQTEHAARYLGRGTSWCTAYTKVPSHFNSYNSEGTLYVLYAGSEEGPRKYQFFIPDSNSTKYGAEFKDKDDNEIAGTQHIKFLSGVPGYKEFVDKLITQVLGRLDNS
jgi:hypothetical protein